MKKTIKEELERIHTLTYGKDVIQESFIDDLLRILKLVMKIDEPNKADYITGDVDDFYKTLEQAKNSGGLSQQPASTREYQKGVEALQIGLILLNYNLPSHGVDGLFGDETADAVKKFKKDNFIDQSNDNSEVIVSNGWTLLNGGSSEISKKKSDGCKVKKASDGKIYYKCNSSTNVTENYRVKNIRESQTELDVFPVHGPYNIGYDRSWDNFNNPIGTANSDFSKKPTGHGAGGHPKGHYGIDIFGPRGTDIVSPVKGKVQLHFGNGNTVIINDLNGYSHWLGHLDSITVKDGELVAAGTKVGTLGNTGNAKGTSPHLHYNLYTTSRGFYSGEDPLNVLKNAIGKTPTGYEQPPSSDEYISSSSSSSSSRGSDISTSGDATPEMLKQLIEKLKQKNITSDDLKKYSDKTTKSDYKGTTDDDFYESILKCIGAPVSAENMLFMYAWRQSEGGVYRNNPFNTKRKYPGAEGDGVKNYQTAQDGINATCETLKLNHYTCIVDGLRNDIGALNISQKCDSALYTWGTHHTNPLVTNVLKSYQSGSIPKPKSIIS
jgi:murein DD-endopeptidase MepM/ murein hydrolase activator NlpD